MRILGRLDRRIGGIRAGSGAYVWMTGAAGRRLLQTRASEPRQRFHEPSERFLRHSLAIADAHIALVEAHRDKRLELLQVETEPSCWRPYVGPSGARAVMQPDLYVVTGDGEYEDGWFLEVDLGNEHVPTLIRKCRDYQLYRQAGIEQERAGSFPWVVWIMSTPARADKFRDALSSAQHLDVEPFHVTTHDGLLDLITTTNQ